MRRREFLNVLAGTAAAWPLAVRAQTGAIPVIGVLHPQSPEGMDFRVRAFRQGLKEGSLIEGENVAVEYRWAENRVERLPELAAGLVQRKIAVIVAISPAAARAAKAATASIPIVFAVADDPVQLGLVTSLARPGGNVTGFNFVLNELTAKRLELLREMVPTAARIAVLVNPSNPLDAVPTMNEIERAAQTMGLQLRFLNASTSHEIGAAFATVAQERSDALFVAPDAMFIARRVQITHLASRHAIPASYSNRDYAEAGGLMSYGSDVTDTWRQTAIYASRILKGAKPADLPVVQTSKLELIINHEAARLIGLKVPQSLLTAADEVIE